MNMRDAHNKAAALSIECGDVVLVAKAAPGELARGFYAEPDTGLVPAAQVVARYEDGTLTTEPSC